MEKKIGFAAVLSNRNFRFLWANQILFQLAYNMVNFSLIILVFKSTGSNTAVSFFVLSIIVPSIIFGAFAGVLADYLDKRKIILITDLLLAAIIFGLAFIRQQYFWILGFSFVVNAVNQFFIPTEASAIPMLVSKKALIVANSLFSFTMYGAMFLGFSLAGPLLQFFGGDAPFYVASAAIFLGFLIVIRLPSLRATKDKHFGDSLQEAKNVAVKEVGAGLWFVRRQHIILISILLLVMAQGRIGVIAVLAPGFFEDVLQISATAASYILIAPAGLGLIVGALLVGRFGHRFRKRYLITRAAMGMGIALMLIALAPIISTFLSHHVISLQQRLPRPIEHIFSLSAFLMLVSFLMGLATVFVVVPSMTTISEFTPTDMRGRVFSVLNILTASASAFPILLTGSLADIFGTIPILIFIGLLLLGIGVLAIKPEVVSFLAKKGLMPHKVEAFMNQC